MAIFDIRVWIVALIALKGANIMQDFLIVLDRGQYDFYIWIGIALITFFVIVFYAKGEH